MKKAIIVLLCGFMVMAAGGCKSDDSSTNSNSNFTQTMTAKIDGVDWSATSTTAVIQSGGGLGTVANIIGQNSSKGTISLSVTEPKVGEFNISVQAHNAGTISLSSGNFTSVFCDNTGKKIVITKLTDSEIEGTFTFNGKDDIVSGTTKNVTEGAFHLKLTK